MTRDDIIRMARESADQSPREDWNTNAWVFGEDALERFFHAAYAAGAAAERNKVAQWIMARGYSTGHGDTVADLLKELELTVREQERELCAQICEQIADAPSNMVLGVALDCAKAIRGEK